MGKNNAKVLSLSPRRVDEAGEHLLVVDLLNRSTQEITVVTLARYLILELESEARTFVRGVAAGGGDLPAAADYVSIPPGGEVKGAFRLSMAQAQSRLPEILQSQDPSVHAYAIGPFHFEGIRTATRLRVVYKAEMIMPNLPPKKQRSFLRGPVEAEETKLELP